MTCCFFGHRDTPDSIGETLKTQIEALIHEGVACFLVGHQGRFDALALQNLRKLKQTYPHIHYAVVLAYLPQKTIAEITIFPEGLELVPPKFAISKRNLWMLSKSQIVITYVTHNCGGAAQMAELAQKQGKRIIALGNKTA